MSWILVWGFTTFALCLAAHILWWRFKRPSNDMAALFKIFLLAPAPLAAAAWLIFLPGRFGWEFAAWALLHAALSCAYIQSYPPAQAESPSLKMLILIAEAMPAGLRREELLSHFDNTELVSRRFEDLLNNRLMRQENGIFVLNPVGRNIARFFVFYRKILGLPVGGG